MNKEITGTYTVHVKRSGTDSGTITFQSGGTSISTACWWDPAVVIKPGVYVSCSKTRMETKTDSVTGKKRPGIYLPDAVAPDSNKHTIFLHEGKDPSWSDGCIVLARDLMMQMWNTITPSDGKNVVVTVIDS